MGRTKGKENRGPQLRAEHRCIKSLISLPIECTINLNQYAGTYKWRNAVFKLRFGEYWMDSLKLFSRNERALACS